VILNNKQDVCLEIKEITQGLGVDIAIDAVGTSESMNQSIEIVKNGGQVNVIGLAANTVEINVRSWYAGRSV
jgi:threonine dehydrogenase-like Zn-dependent dehydrogenase